MTEEKNTKTFIYIILSIVITVILIAVFGVIIYNKINNEKKSEAQTTNTISIISFGATPNDETDDTSAIQRAINSRKSGTVIVPAGRYIISKPIFMKSNIKLQGVERRSILINQGQDSENAHIVLGDAHPYAFDDRHPSKNIFSNLQVKESVWQKNSKKITLKNRSDISKIKINKIVCIRSKKNFYIGTSGDGWAQPDFVQFVQVAKLSNKTIYFNDFALNSIKNPQLCNIDGTDPYYSFVMKRQIKWYAVQNAKISGLVFVGGDLGIDRGLCYKCTISNVRFYNNKSPLRLNAMVKSNVTNVAGDYNEELLEIKMGSSQSVFSNFEFVYKKLEGKPQKTQAAVDIGERSVGITLNNINLDVGPEWSGQSRLIRTGDAQKVSFSNFDLNIHGGGGQQIFELRGNINAAEGSDFPTKDFTYYNNSINLGIQKSELVIMAGSERLPINNVQFINNTWFGTNTTADTAYWAANFVKNWSVSGDKIYNAKKMNVSSNSDIPKITSVLYRGN